LTNQASPETVVFVLWEGLQVISGVTSWVGALRPHLEQRGWRVRVLILDPSQDEAILGKPDGVFVSLRQLKDALRPFSPAVVVLMNILRQSSFGPVIASLNGQGCRFHAISVVHSDDYQEYYSHVPVIAPWVHHLIAVSPIVAQTTRQALPEGTTIPVSMLPCGVDCPTQLRRSYQSCPIRLVHMGRLNQTQKRVLDLVPLVEALFRRGVPFNLSIYGVGWEDQRLRERLANHVQAGRVIFGGKCAHDELVRRLADYDVFVNVSEYEGTSVAMLEAMAQGCVPVVTCASSGVTEVIESGKNGFHAPVADMEGLAEHIAKLAGSPKLLQTLGSEAHRTVAQRYAMDQYADRFSALLGGVVTEEPIRTSPDAERVLDCLLPVEANAREQVADLRRYVDSRFGDIDSQFAVVNSNIATRFGRAIAPTLRWAKRMVRGRI
jgi:glycosyltransferase involved in cell wall biosynthesis